MADYLTARAAIASIIDDVAITVPVAADIAQVHQTPPDSNAAMKFPCVIITGYQLRYQRQPSSGRERTYTIGLQLIVRPLEGTTMRTLLDALKEAISAAFDTKVTLGLGGGYHVVEGPNWTQTEPVVEGVSVRDEGEILLKITDTATIGA